MANKINAHFLDCDINPDAKSWSCGGSEELVATYSMTYISEIGTIWGLPLRDGTMPGLDAGGVAVDRGDGIVGLPFTGHPFSAGMRIQIVGTTNYEYLHILTSGTSENELQFADTYTAETFDGTETVAMRYGMQVASPSYAMVRDSNGDFYYSHAWNGTRTITKVDSTSWTESDPGMLYGAYRDTCRAMALSADGLYLYAIIGDYVIKWNFETGTLIWATNINSPGYDIEIDASGNAYVAKNSEVRKLDADTGVLTSLTDMGQPPPGIDMLGGLQYDIAVSDALGLVAGAGYTYTFIADADHLFNIGVRKFDNSAGETVQLDTYRTTTIAYSRLIGTGCTVFHGNYLYALVANSASGTPELYKLQWSGGSLNTIAQYTLTSSPYAIGMFFDLYGNLVIVNVRLASSNRDIIHYYDTEGNLLAKIDNLPSGMCNSWDLGAGGSWAQGDIEFDGVVGGTASSAEPNQSRALWYPSDWSHLEGETVQVLGDGAYLGTEEVVSGEVDLDDNTTVNHVGLAYTSYLQPMKPDGEVYIKDIGEVLLQLNTTLGGKYGEELTRLWEIIFRDRDDEFGDSSALFTGYKRLDYDGQYSRKGDIWIVQDIPLPMIVLGIIMKMLVEDGGK